MRGGFDTHQRCSAGPGARLCNRRMSQDLRLLHTGAEPSKSLSLATLFRIGLATTWRMNERGN